MKICLLLSLLVCLSGCETSAYYSQLASGQWTLLDDREPIAELVENPDTPASLRERLVLVQSIRDFASEQLTLPDNQSYRYYVDLQRSHAVWNVYAAEEFSTRAMEWCFPIAGCVGYRGYFDEQQANNFAAELSAQGQDSFVGGVAAYSTLGWFDDPVLNTFIYRSDTRLAGLLFHELAHQQIYLPGDTAFNESFARAVEIEGVRRWLSHQQRQQQMEEYLLDQQLHKDFVSTLLAGRKELEALYAQDLPIEEKRRRKQALLIRIQQNDYAAFKQRWHGAGQYDAWVARDFNNAKLATLANYHQWLPAFQQLLDDQEGNFDDFFTRVDQLSELESVERNQQLQALNLRWSATLAAKATQ